MRRNALAFSVWSCAFGCWNTSFLTLPHAMLVNMDDFALLGSTQCLIMFFVPSGPSKMQIWTLMWLGGAALKPNGGGSWWYSSFFHAALYNSSSSGGFGSVCPMIKST